MIVKGITKRWLLNSLGMIIVTLIAIEIGLAVFIHEFFYNGVQQTINNKSAGLVNVFPGYKEDSEKDFIFKAKIYVSDFEDKNLMEVVAFNSNDEPILTSTGFLPESILKTTDYTTAKESNSNVGTFVGKNSSGENIMAQTRAIYTNDGEYVGAVRYIVSLRSVDNTVFWLIIGCITIGLAILFFVIMSSSYFINSIVNPIREIGKTARKIALGDFNARIDKSYDDEVGELCDTVNYMARKLGESEKVKNEFISSISHELRTPLTAIKGWAETIDLGDEKDFEMNRRGLKVIIHESERLCGLVEELLDFSRLQCGKMVLTLERIDILAELSEAVYMFKDRAASEQKELVYSEPPMLSPVLGDKNRLRQVFINIIDNALKYTAKGGTITIKVKEAAGYIYITVSDTGCGIPAEHLPYIKDKFYKANTTQKGSGIGLAVVDELIKMHSGTLDITSEENVGTVVTISIPIAKPQSES